jgi:peptidoglycan hydrolase FlgJ
MENANMSHVSAANILPAGALPRTLREATQEFESLFVAQMMREMRSTIPESGLLGAGSGQQIFREMLDQELSRRAAYSGNFGIGELLYRQLGGDESNENSHRSQDDENR